VDKNKELQLREY